MTDTNPLEYDANRRAVIGAAHAAASWVRARRAVWSDSPLEIPPPVDNISVPAAKPELPVVVAFGLPAPQAPLPPAVEWILPVPDDNDFDAGTNVPVAVATGRRKAAPGGAIARIRSVRIPAGRWMVFAGAAALAIVIGVTTTAHWSKGAATAKAAVNALDAVVVASRAARRPAAPQPPARTTGRLELTSEPAGAQVVLDGKSRGVTPLTIDDLAPGTHAFELQSSEGSVHRSFVVKAGETAQLSESIFAGWVKVFAPFEVVIREGAKAIPLEEGNQIMLPAGRHQLHVVNRQLGYDTVHQVDLKPGETSSISLAAPTSTIAVKTSVPAEIWVDGVRAGEAPLAGMSVAVGTHEIVAKQPTGEERRSVVTVTVKPLTIEMDFARP